MHNFALARKQKKLPRISAIASSLSCVSPARAIRRLSCLSATTLSSAQTQKNYHSKSTSRKHHPLLVNPPVILESISTAPLLNSTQGKWHNNHRVPTLLTHCKVKSIAQFVYKSINLTIIKDQFLYPWSKNI